MAQEVTAMFGSALQHMINDKMRKIQKSRLEWRDLAIYDKYDQQKSDYSTIATAATIPIDILSCSL